MSGKRVKHSSKRYERENAKISKLRIFIALIIICAVIIFIVFINNKENMPDTSKQEIEMTLNDIFLNFKSLNVDKINQYLEYDLLISGFDPMLVETNSELSFDIQEKMFENIKWTIEDIEINGNEAVVIVEMTNINFKIIVTNWMKEIVSISSTGVVITNDLALEKLFEILNQENIEEKTVLKKIRFIKENDKWYLELTDDFRDLIYPGIDSVITVFNENI